MAITRASEAYTDAEARWKAGHKRDCAPQAEAKAGDCSVDHGTGHTKSSAEAKASAAFKSAKACSIFCAYCGARSGHKLTCGKCWKAGKRDVNYCGAACQR